MNIPLDTPGHRFKSWATLLVVLRAADLFTTWKYTPELKAELNPLVRQLGLGWGGFMVMQLLLLLLILGVSWFYFHTKSLPVEQKNLNFQDFIYLYFFKELKVGFKRLFPSSSRHLNHLKFMSFMILVASLGISVFAVSNNLMLLWHVEWYVRLLVRYGHIFLPSIFMGVIAGSSLIFFTRQYRQYKRYSATE